MEELTIHHLAGKLNVAADHLPRPDKEGAPPGLEEIQIRVMNEAWMLDSRLPRQGCNRISGEKPQGFCQSLATFEAASVMLKQGELSRALRPLALLFDAVSHMNEPYAAAIFFQRSKMEVVPAEIAEDDSTLSWWQLIGCGLCFLCCYGVSAATCRCLGAMGTRFKTKWQGEAPKLKEKNREQLRGQLPMPPTHEGPGFSGGPGHAQKASQKEHTVGHGQKSSASDSGSGGQKTMVSSDRLLLGSGRNLLTRPTGKGILQLGALEGRTGMYE